MVRSWAELPVGRVVRLSCADFEVMALPIEPLPDGAPAVFTYSADSARSVAEMVAVVLRELETAAVDVFPAWLPGAEAIDGPGSAAVVALRALALRASSTTRHFGPFLADLAELSLTGTARRASRFSPEVRAAGLARVLAAGFGRPRTSILVRVPEGLSAVGEEVFVAGFEWLADHGEFGVWLTGAPLRTVDRVETVMVRLSGEVARIAPEPPPAAERPAGHTIGYPAAAGRPHPASRAEKTLEKALASCAWAAGRAWNQTYQSHPLTNPIRVDLLWREERCVVEIDGVDHLAPSHYTADRQRDVRLQLDGYAVLRFTNDQILTDIENVVGMMERFLLRRRIGTLEGPPHV